MRYSRISNARLSAGKLRFAAIAASICFLFTFAASAQGPNSAASASPTPSPTPGQTPIPLVSIVSQADAAAAKLRDFSAFLNSQPDNFEINAGLPRLQSQIDEQVPETAAALRGRPSLDELNRLESAWRSSNNELLGWKELLQEQSTELDKRLKEVTNLKDLWLATKDSLNVADETSASRSNTPSSNTLLPAVPDEISRRVSETIFSIGESQKELERSRADLLELQSKVSDLESRTQLVLSSIKDRRAYELSRLFVRDSEPIWSAEGAGLSPAGIFGQIASSMSTRFLSLRVYAGTHIEGFVLHAVVILFLIFGFYWAGKRIVPIVESEPKLERSAAAFQHPIASALLISTIFTAFFYRQAPALLTTLMGLAVVIPAIFLLRRSLERAFFPIIYALVAFYFFDRIRELAAEIVLLSRVLFLAEMLAAAGFFVWFRRSKKLAAGIEAGSHRAFSSVRRFVPIGILIFAAAFLANLTGYVTLSIILGNGVLRSAYLALVLLAAYELVSGLVVFAFRVRPLSLLTMVKNERTLIRMRLMWFVRWSAIAVWLLVTLYLFSVHDLVLSAFGRIVSASFSLGSISLSVGHVLVFIVSVWAAFLISRFIRFVLEEDVYTRVGLSGGVSYAISTTVHYVIIIGGFLFAVAALGFQLSQFAIILGAVGIGVGLGLQNIINNFVSGLILLFERPVKVGDTVQIGTHIGSLTQIGLRASVLRKVDGSDVILPNSQLISDEVINWTMSDDKRRLDISVGVAYGTDPQKVLSLLKKAASENNDIMTSPEPRALFLGMGESSLDFELRAWTENSDNWVPIRSDLVTAVYAALTDAGIEIPFPQRDLNIRSVDTKTIESLTGE